MAKKKKISIPAEYRKSRVGLEIDSVCAKAVQLKLKKDGGIQIEKLAVTELKYFTYDEVPEILKNFFKDNAFKARNVISCFPRNLTMIRFLKLPSSDPKEIEEMVGFQAIKQIPYNREDMIVDYEILSTDEEGYSNIMLSIAHRNVIYQHLETIEYSGLDTKRIDINSQAALRAYLYLKELEEQQNEKTDKENEESDKPKKTVCAALINIDFAQTNIQIISGDNLLFSRGISLGIMHLVLKEKKFQSESANINWQSELMDELRRSFAVFSREQSGLFVEKIVLIGGYSNFKNIDRNIAGRFQVPVEIFDLSTRVEGYEELASGLKLSNKEISFLAIIGLLLPDRARRLDMIPAEVKQKRRYFHRVAVGTVASLLLACLLVVGLVNFYSEIRRKSDYISQLQERIQTLSPRVSQLEKMREKINVINEYIGSDVTSLDYLRELYVLVPEKISLAAFMFDETKYVVIKGTAENMSDVLELIPQLEGSGLFEKVSSSGVKRRKVGNKEVFDFEIQCSFEKEGGQA